MATAIILLQFAIVLALIFKGARTGGIGLGIYGMVGVFILVFIFGLKPGHLPMFFIHGDKDDYVPTWMVYKLYEAKPQPKALWIVPEADHAHSYLFNTEEYTQKVKAFVDKYIQ